MTDDDPMDGIDYSSNFTYGNPLLFLAFIADVIKKTIFLKDADQPIDIFKIIPDVAGGRMGIPVEADQLKNLMM